MNFKSNTVINQLRIYRYCWSLTDAIYIYGEDAQIWMAIEEMSELTKIPARKPTV